MWQDESMNYFLSRIDIKRPVKTSHNTDDYIVHFHAQLTILSHLQMRFLRFVTRNSAEWLVS